MTVQNRRTSASVGIRGVGVCSFVTLGAAACVAVTIAVGGVVAPHPTDAVLGTPWAVAPGAPLGTDSLGRDVLSRTLAGGVSITGTSLLAGLAATTVGTAAGLLAGWFPGPWDRAVRMVTDVLLALPALLAALILAVIVPGRPGVVAATVLVGSPLTARLVRDGTLRVRHTGFVQAARARGESTPAVLVREVLPALAGVIAADAGLRFVIALQLASALGVLGFGAQPPAADWALMLRENLPGIGLNPAAVLAPACALAVTACTFAVAANLAVGSRGRLAGPGGVA